MGCGRRTSGRPGLRFLFFANLTTCLCWLHMYWPWLRFAYGCRTIKNTFLINGARHVGQGTRSVCQRCLAEDIHVYLLLDSLLSELLEAARHWIVWLSFQVICYFFFPHSLTSTVAPKKPNRRNKGGAKGAAPPTASRRLIWCFVLSGNLGVRFSIIVPQFSQ